MHLQIKYLQKYNGSILLLYSRYLQESQGRYYNEAPQQQFKAYSTSYKNINSH